MCVRFVFYVSFARPKVCMFCFLLSAHRQPLLTVHLQHKLLPIYWNLCRSFGNCTILLSEYWWILFFSERFKQLHVKQWVVLRSMLDRAQHLFWFKHSDSCLARFFPLQHIVRWNINVVKCYAPFTSKSHSTWAGELLPLILRVFFVEFFWVWIIWNFHWC